MWHADDRAGSSCGANGWGLRPGIYSKGCRAVVFVRRCPIHSSPKGNSFTTPRKARCAGRPPCNSPSTKSGAHAILAMRRVDRVQAVDQQVLHQIGWNATSAQNHIDPDECLFTVVVPVALQGSRNLATVLEQELNAPVTINAMR